SGPKVRRGITAQQSAHSDIDLKCHSTSAFAFLNGSLCYRRQTVMTQWLSTWVHSASPGRRFPLLVLPNPERRSVECRPQLGGFLLQPLRFGIALGNRCCVHASRLLGKAESLRLEHLR